MIFLYTREIFIYYVGARDFLLYKSPVANICRKENLGLVSSF